MRPCSIAHAIVPCFVALALGHGRAAIAAAQSGAAAAPDAGVQRALTLLSAVGEEYREGVANGQVIRPIEFDEARAFLTDAEERLRTVVPDASPQFAQVQAAMDAHAAPDDVAVKLAALRQAVVQRTGIEEQVYPPQPPSAARGAALFQDYCAACHGSAGDGRGPNAANLNPPPANFTDAQFMRGETPYDFYHVISLGKRNTAMPSWDGVLSPQDRWDLIAFLWSLAPQPEHLAQGQGIYLSQCAGCHGATGDGRGPYAAGLLKPIPDLRPLQSLARLSDTQLYAAVAHGVPGSPMPAFDRTLTDDQRWDAVAFTRMLALGGVPPASANGAGGGFDPKRFGGLLSLLGRAYADAMQAAPPARAVEDAELEALRVQVSGQSRVAALLAGDHAGAEIRAAADALDESLRQRAGSDAVARRTEALRAVIAAHTELWQVPTGATAASDDPAAVLQDTEGMLAEALQRYRAADPHAAETVADAYFRFDPLEARIGAVDQGLKTRIEEQFLRLRAIMRAPGRADDAAATVAEIEAGLREAAAALRPRGSGWALLAESATIILREGLEIVLVVGALLAYVGKSRNRVLQRAVRAGTAGGVIASIATACVLGELFRLRPSASDVLEGITMLLAAAVLFWVSYWLISKSEADRWQRYIRGKVETAVTGGSGMALAAAAFLAVYREGFETVLFYQALYASAPAGALTITIGFAAGGALLALVYVLLRRFQVQIPVRQFFVFTGAFLYVMAAVFAGQGMHELQDAGWIAATPLTVVPAMPLLGVFPTVQSLAVQAVFVLLALYAAARLRTRRSSVAADTPLLHELRALRGAVESTRADLQRLVQSGGATSAAMEKLEALLARTAAVVDEALPRAGGNGNGGGRRGG